MNRIKQYHCALDPMAWLLLATLVLVGTGRAFAAEETFDVLQTKTATYENVTVTSKNAEWILILHSAGMGNVKVADLPDDVRETLGYKVAKAQPMRISVPKLEALVADIKLPEVEQLRQSWREGGVEAVIKTLGDPRIVWSVMGIAVLLHLLFSYCSMLICRKAHTSPGFLVWLPVLQFIPLLRAAGMSGLWFFALLVPVINLVVQIVWYVNIARARGKGPFLVVWLLLPLTTPFAFLYLALSEVTPIRMKTQVPFALE